MTDVDEHSEERLTQLARRWELDKGSRVFVQLAEEYRRAGRVREALAVLEDGLERHPGYLAAHVALGRCRMAVGQAGEAVEVLEDVVRRDPTQMVAYKLLVEAYLANGQAVAAQNRLSRYTLLNDSDPETEALERRIQTLADQDTSSSGPSKAAVEGGGDPFPLLIAKPEDTKRFLEGLAAEGLFSLPPLAPPPMDETAASIAPAEAETSVDADTGGSAADQEAADQEAGDQTAGDQAAPGAAIGQEEASGGTRAAADQAETATESAETTAAQRARNPNDPFDLSGPPVKTADAEGLFSLSTDEEPGESLSRSPDESAALEADAAEPDSSPEDESSEGLTAGAALAGAAAVGAATVTLGRIYQKQGHHDEASRIFREVLERDPDDAEAGQALAELAEADQTAMETADPSDAEDHSAEAISATVSASEDDAAAGAAEPESNLAEQGEALSASDPAADDYLQDYSSADHGPGLTAKKIHVLKQYRERLRRRSDSDVH